MKSLVTAAAENSHALLSEKEGSVLEKVRRSFVIKTWLTISVTIEVLLIMMADKYSYATTITTL